MFPFTNLLYFKYLFLFAVHRIQLVSLHPNTFEDDYFFNSKYALFFLIYLLQSNKLYLFRVWNQTCNCVSQLECSLSSSSVHSTY